MMGPKKFLNKKLLPPCPKTKFLEIPLALSNKFFKKASLRNLFTFWDHKKEYVTNNQDSETE
jgi:hypothetical protein